ncbi:MAG: ABC transporter permease subunit [Desulfobacterales bacterium]|nr:ABC transporter permease subunit [Desulfobacterales bacterium]
MVKKRTLSTLLILSSLAVRAIFTVASGILTFTDNPGDAFVPGNRPDLPTLTFYTTGLATTPVLWITFLMVWAGSGGVVPIIVVVASLFPPLFANVTRGVMDLDERLFDMARVYRVKPMKVLTGVVLPGAWPYILAGMSYALGACWKVVAVAEFLGASSGIGARLYWAYPGWISGCRSWTPIWTRWIEAWRRFKRSNRNLPTALPRRRPILNMGGSLE